MTLPGVSVSISDEPVPAFQGFDTGAAFVVGKSQRGPDTPVAVRSMDGFARVLGERTAESSVLFDWLDVFFREGGSIAYVQRVTGDDATSSTVTVPNDESGDPTAATITASSGGVWGDDVDVTIGDGVVSGFRITVAYRSVTVEVSPDLADLDQASAWAEGSDYISWVSGDGAPTNGTYALAGGDDDGDAVTDDDLVAALDAFAPALGPGQVAIPGKTTDAIHVGLLDHVADGRRVALLDLEDTSQVTTLAGDVAAVRSYAGSRFAATFAPWAIVPGIVAGTTRTVPYSAVEAGRIAALDAVTSNPNQAAAGVNGVARYAIDLSQPEWADDEREALADAGVNVVRPILGGIRAYDFRTVVNALIDARWREFSGSRLVMAILADSYEIAETFEFAQLDGRGQKVAEFGADITAVVAGYYQRDALYGATPADAFVVNTGDPVNTDESLGQGILRAAIALRTSPFAERVEITLTRRLTTESVA